MALCGTHSKVSSTYDKLQIGHPRRRKDYLLMTVAYINDNGIQTTAQQLVVHQLFHTSAILLII